MRATRLVWGIRFALSDMVNVKWRTWLDAIGMASVLALLLILSGLRDGAVGGFASDQLNTPEARRVLVVPSAGITQENLAWLRSQPEVLFAQPNASSINSRVPIGRQAECAQNGETNLSGLILPTGAHDPYLNDQQSTPNGFELAIGNDVANALGLSVGDGLCLNLPGTAYHDPSLVTLNIVAIIETSDWFNLALMMDPDLVIAIESRSYDPDIDLSNLGGRFGLTEQDRFPSIRLYARDLQSVSPLVSKVRSLGWHAESRESLIRERNALEQATSLVLIVILALAFTAYGVLLIMNTSARTSRLSRGLNNVRIHGTGALFSAIVVFTETIVVLLLSWSFGLLAAFGGAFVMNTVLPDILANLNFNGAACRISLEACLGTGAASAFLTILASLSTLSSVNGGNSIETR